MELLKAVLFGIVEGVTEWLPISSTGHLIVLNEFITLNVSDEFRSMFDMAAVVQGHRRHHPLGHRGRAV